MMGVPLKPHRARLRLGETEVLIRKAIIALHSEYDLLSSEPS